MNVWTVAVFVASAAAQHLQTFMPPPPTVGIPRNERPRNVRPWVSPATVPARPPAPPPPTTPGECVPPGEKK